MTKREAIQEIRGHVVVALEKALDLKTEAGEGTHLYSNVNDWAGDLEDLESRLAEYLEEE